jgi:acetyl esterase
MHLHGGGWTICQPETETALCKFMAENLGVIVVAPDYCKAPQYPYPNALEQLHAVASWIASGGLKKAVKDNGYDSEFNQNKIALSGGSSGSNLAAALTLYAQEHPLPDGAHIAGLGILYPVLNLAVPYEEKLSRVDPNRVLPPFMSKLFLKSYLPPSANLTDPYISPALASPEQLAKFPPTVILTAEYDYLANEADQFAKALTDLGVRVDHKRFPHVGHAFDGMPARNKKQRSLNRGARDEAWGMMAFVFAEVLKDERVDVKDVVRKLDETLERRPKYQHSAKSRLSINAEES